MGDAVPAETLGAQEMVVNRSPSIRRWRLWPGVLALDSNFRSTGQFFETDRNWEGVSDAVKAAHNQRKSAGAFSASVG
jgi:hypothetical protein